LFQIIFKFVVDSITKTPREARFFVCVDSVTVNTEVHTESEACQKQCSDSDSDSSFGSILGACLDGFNGDAWMSDADEAQDNILVGATAGVNDPGDIPWRTTEWSAGTEVVPSAKVAKTALRVATSLPER